MFGTSGNLANPFCSLSCGCSKAAGRAALASVLGQRGKRTFSRQAIMSIAAASTSAEGGERLPYPEPPSAAIGAGPQRRQGIEQGADIHQGQVAWLGASLYRRRRLSGCLRVVLLHFLCSGELTGPLLPAGCLRHRTPPRAQLCFFPLGGFSNHC